MAGQTLKKPSIHNFNGKKPKNTFSNPQPVHLNQTHFFYGSLSSMGTTTKNRQTTKNSPMPFLPPVSGASAFSNYSTTTTGHSTTILNKVCS